MDRRYKHLNSEERGVIFAEHRRGASLRTIGSLLGRDASTISRELRRGQGDDGLYSPAAGRRGYDTNRLRSRRPHKLIEGTISKPCDYPPSFANMTSRREYAPQKAWIMCAIGPD